MDLGTLVALADVLLMNVWEPLEPLRGEQWVSSKGVRGPKAAPGADAPEGP